MSRARPLFLCSLMLLSGCIWPVREQADRILVDLAHHPFDPLPAQERSESKSTTEEGKPSPKPAVNQTNAPVQETDVQTTALMQAEPETKERREAAKYDLKIPAAIPGSEARPIDFKNLTPEQKQRAIQRLYGELPPLPVEPIAQRGPNGRPYTLSDLQQLAVENSPALRQVVYDLKNAEGNLVQARTYQNPIVGYAGQPTNNNSTTGAQGAFVQQHITTFGKRPLQVAAAQKDYDNAELALRRARSDLATQVRNAYYGLLIAKETVRVNKELSRFTDEIYRLYTGYLSGGFVASYEPAALRGQASTARLAYQQAIYAYISAWQQLVATIGLRQLPLSEVGGRVDLRIPYYDYDAVLAHVLANHTDILTARAGKEKARYLMKLSQITPYPDFDLQAYVFKETTLAPFSIFYTVQVGFPMPIFDQNKGAIMASQAALMRAVEEERRVALALTNTLSTNYLNYKNNLEALEAYRRYILPDLVRTYRGVFERRQIDISNVNALNAAPGDLVAAQAALATNVTNYLVILGQLWTSVVSVADLLQTDDLFQLAKPRELPELPALENLPHLLEPPAKPEREPELPAPQRLP
jgi:cobalt-zinc-cadmium efflux system outer membrane protein